jgi:DNA-binding MarR family transcriptional regulator
LESTFNLTHAIKKELSNQLEYQEMGIAPMHIRVLKVIHEQKSCTAIEVARLFKRDKAQITRLVSYLIDKDFVEKKPNPNDQRSQLLVLSPQGKTLHQSLLTFSEEIEQKMIQDIDPKDIEVFMNVAKKMTRNLS